MYLHTPNVNSCYFGEVDATCDNEGEILARRKRGFDLLKKTPDFSINKPVPGSCSETWSAKGSSPFYLA